MSEVKLKIEAPRFPNYLKLIGAGIVQHLFDIADLSDEELEAFAEDWKKQLIAHAVKRRTHKE